MHYLFIKQAVFIFVDHCIKFRDVFLSWLGFIVEYLCNKCVIEPKQPFRTNSNRFVCQLLQKQIYCIIVIHKIPFSILLIQEPTPESCHLSRII